MKNKDSRIKYNVVSSIVYQVVLLVISFLLPRLYLENFGSEVNGVLSTIKQIFAYLILLEAGVGLATTQALYKKMGENDKAGAGAVLSATNIYYRKTGIIYLVLVLIIAVIYAFVVPTGMNELTVFWIVILTALPSLFSYFIQAKYRILMEVDGRKYVINNSETAVQLVANIGKVLVLVLTDSLILIQLVYCIISLCQLLFLYIYAKRRYKWLDLSVKPDFASIAQKNSVLVHQLSGMVFNNTDIILLSLLCDFKVVSVYAIYNIFFSQMQTFITSVVSGFNFALGQMFHADKEKFLKVFDIYETLYIGATFIIYTLMAVFILPLIQIYTSGVNDANYSNVYLILLFVIMNLLANGKLPANIIVEYSGDFRETRHQAIWEMIINICVSVVAIIYFGICGAIFGTIAALVYRSIAMIGYSNKNVLGRNAFSTYRHWLVNGAVFVIIMAVLFVDTFSGVSFGKLVLMGILNSVWIVLLYVCANLLFEKNLIKNIISLRKGDKES